MFNATATAADLTTFLGLDSLDLRAVWQRVDETVAEVGCTVTSLDPWCPSCGGQGRLHDHVRRRLAHVPLGGRPTALIVEVLEDYSKVCLWNCGAMTVVMVWVNVWKGLR